MHDADQIESLKVLTEVARERERPRKGLRLASVRVSPGPYFAASSVLTFCSALLLRSNEDFAALLTLGIAWLAMPVLALSDRVEFDGESLVRCGPLPFVIRYLTRRRKELKVADFEKVDTHAVRTLRRRGRVRYRYRTQIVGKNSEFVFASGGRSYRQMVRQLFPLIHKDKLDLRTIELRDYLCEPRPLNQEVDSLHLASADILESATSEFKLGGQKRKPADGKVPLRTNLDDERAMLLGRVGNKLRIAGRLSEAREAFRRALIVIPKDSRLIFDFARLLRSQAGSLSDPKLLSRARAALRLSARRAEREPELLALVGESFLEWGETIRAHSSFQKAIELEPRNFRARIGLANLALRQGKLAHVIHQYRDAAQAASDTALSRHAAREAEYYALLNEDDDYLITELRRINWLQHSLKVRRLAARVTNLSILVALLAPFVEESVAGPSWYLASSSLIAWMSSLMAIKLLGKRRTARLAS
jgi:tetratricopeptide (TPR) repeat protein